MTTSQMRAPKKDITAPNGLAQEGKYLLFEIADEQYGLPILQAREIIGLESITRVPRTSESILGVINLRGKVIPVMDLRTRFGLESTTPTEDTVIIVLQCAVSKSPLTIGVVVDAVHEVVLLHAEHISVPPLGTRSEEEFIIGIGTPTEGQIIFLLNVDKIVCFEAEAQP